MYIVQIELIGTTIFFLYNFGVNRNNIAAII
jgi:hypothetical protein